jgi:hypothetical protein
MVEGEGRKLRKPPALKKGALKRDDHFNGAFFQDS